MFTSCIHGMYVMNWFFVMLHQRIASLESENEKLKKSLKDCEEALAMANGETEKSNKVSREAKNRISELDARVKDLEGEVQAAGAKAAELELQLKKASELHAEAEKKMKEYQDKLAQIEQTNTKFEKDLEGVHTGLQEREMKLEDMSQNLVDKDGLLEKKEAKIADLSEKVRFCLCCKRTYHVKDIFELKGRLLRDVPTHVCPEDDAGVLTCVSLFSA